MDILKDTWYWIIDHPVADDDIWMPVFVTENYEFVLNNILYKADALKNDDYLVKKAVMPMMPEKF